MKIVIEIPVGINQEGETFYDANRRNCCILECCRMSYVPASKCRDMPRGDGEEGGFPVLSQGLRWGKNLVCVL